ncbi:MAG: phytanoyl-CoA dioxygenase family protein [bacterium]
MEVNGVRLHHDQALYKEPGGGFTPWHADQQYWPLASDKSITAWIPLQQTPVEMGPLAFASKSQHFTYGRDLPISDESEALIQKAIREANFEYVEEPFALGEVSFHSGWTFHRAGPNSTGKPRAVMTIIYMDKEMHLGAPANKYQQVDREVFCPGIGVGEIIDSPKNPVVYSPNIQ